MAGFTLIELLIGSAIGALVLAGVMTAFSISVRGFAAAGNYADMQSKTRSILDHFSEDTRRAYVISQFNASNNLVLNVPTSIDNTGTIVSNKTITYNFTNQALRRTDSSIGNSVLLATNVVGLAFTLYDGAGQTTTVSSVARAIQLSLTLRKDILGVAQTDDPISARITMRK
jgi:prepilin-type N-terminal cleavage/methylation domain-containing protein